MPSPAAYQHALATSRTLAEAAAQLGVSQPAVSQWRRNQGLAPLPRGRPKLERACPIDPEPQIGIPAPEFERLLADLGVSETAAVLGISPAAVSNRALRRGLRMAPA